MNKFKVLMKKILDLSYKLGRIVSMLLAIWILFTFGFLWFLAYLVPLTLYQLWGQRDQINMIRDVIEVKVFGKVLDKNQWKEGEMKKWQVETKNYRKEQKKKQKRRA